MTKLQNIRKAKGLSQAQLAVAAEVNVRMLQKYEQGERSINKAEALTVYKLAQVLGCSVEDLLEF